MWSNSCIDGRRCMCISLDEVGYDVTVRVEETMEKVKTESLSLRDEPVAEKAAHARALMKITRLQRDRKKIFEKRKTVCTSVDNRKDQARK